MVACVLARRACILLALFLAFSTVGWSQTQLGTVFGTITDLSGAVVVDAGITLINISTRLKRNVHTDARGEFFLAGLPSGRCSVHVQKQGFQTEVREGIALRSGDAVAINLSLAVGTVPQEITVKADLTGIDDTSSTVGGYLDGRGLTQLPFNGRPFAAFKRQSRANINQWHACTYDRRLRTSDSTGRTIHFLTANWEQFMEAVFGGARWF